MKNIKEGDIVLLKDKRIVKVRGNILTTDRKFIEVESRDNIYVIEDGDIDRVISIEEMRYDYIENEEKYPSSISKCKEIYNNKGFNYNKDGFDLNILDDILISRHLYLSLDYNIDREYYYIIRYGINSFILEEVNVKDIDKNINGHILYFYNSDVRDLFYNNFKEELYKCRYLIK